MSRRRAPTPLLVVLLAAVRLVRERYELADCCHGEFEASGAPPLAPPGVPVERTPGEWEKLVLGGSGRLGRVANFTAG